MGLTARMTVASICRTQTQARRRNANDSPEWSRSKNGERSHDAGATTAARHARAPHVHVTMMMMPRLAKYAPREAATR